MNRYIKAMEIGLANEKEGISYFDLVYQLHGSKERKFNFGAELTFYSWFKENFEVGTVNYELLMEADKGEFQDFLQKDLNNGLYHTPSHYPHLYELLNDRWFINGIAAKQYLDYDELRESRIAAVEARKHSNYSIWISIGAILISTVLGAYTIYSTPDFPYDVKVIEDKTETNKLENEVEELKEELHKAEIIISAYEASD